MSTIIINNNRRVYPHRNGIPKVCLSVMAFLGFVFGGCGLVEDPEPGKDYPNAPEGYLVGLSLSVHDNSGNMTRAPYDPSDGSGHDQSSSYFPDMYENAVNVHDVAVYIFAGTGNSYQLIYNSQDDDKFRIIGSPLSGYNLFSKIPFDNYELDLTELTSSSQVGLRFVILANQHLASSESGGNYDYPKVSVGTDYVTAMNLISQGIETFTIPQGWNPGNTVAGEPRYIPMYGKADFTVNALEFYHSASWQPVNLSDIWLLRAMSKIEINDNINNEEARDDRYPRIESAVLRYAYGSGNLIPAGYLDYQNGNQVENVNLGSNQTGGTYSMTAVRGTYYGNEYPAGRRVRFMRGYCPEQMIVENGTPSVDIAIKPTANASEDEYSHYTVPLYGYNGGVFNWGTNNQLLRNHIYRISVNSVGTPADITVQVMPWESEEIVWDYTDNPGFADGGEIRWVEGTYNNINEETARVYVNPIADGPAVCTFNMVQPQGATWTAFLIDTEGETQNAFKFVDENNNEIATPSGEVGGPVTLRILPRQSAQTVTNSARLQVLVTTADGTRTIIADLCNGKYGNNTYFTIVQSGTGI